MSLFSMSYWELSSFSVIYTLKTIYTSIKSLKAILNGTMFKQEFDLDSLEGYSLCCMSFIDREPGGEVVPPRGGVKGKLQRLNSRTVRAGGPGSTSSCRRPERPEPGKKKKTEAELSLAGILDSF